MNDTQYPSILLENLVNELHKLPGVGKKTALRYALFLLKENITDAESLGNAILQFVRNVSKCKVCNNVCDGDICDICDSKSRDTGVICVVENVSDVMAIENTSRYNGLYHVLGGIISPMNGIGPADLDIDGLIARVKNDDIREVVLALSPDMEGDTTCLYLYKKMLGLGLDIEVSTIARGVSVGNSLEYADEITLGRSIVNRVKYTG